MHANIFNLNGKCFKGRTICSLDIYHNCQLKQKRNIKFATINLELSSRNSRGREKCRRDKGSYALDQDYPQSGQPWTVDDICRRIVQDATRKYKFNFTVNLRILPECRTSRDMANGLKL